MEQITTMEELKNASYHLAHNTKVYFPCVKKAIEFCTKYTNRPRKVWFDTNGMAAFITEDGETYVLPYSSTVAKALTKNDYNRAYIEIPFFEGAHPANEAENEKWQAVLATVVA